MDLMIFVLIIIAIPASLLAFDRFLDVWTAKQEDQE